MFITKKFKFIFFSLIFVLSFLMVAQVALAEEAGSQKALGGLEKTATGGFGSEITKSGTPSEIIGKIVGVALSFLGIFFFILIIIAGYMWMSSMGNEQAAGKAKDILLAAVIGLFIVLIAYAATRLISGIFTS